MIRRSTWILLAVFILLVVAAVLWNRFKPGTGEEIPAAPTATPLKPLLYELGSNIITRIQIVDAEGNEVVVERASGADSWVLGGDMADQSDSFKIGSIVGQLLAIKAMTTFQDPLEINTVGLENPQYVITMTVDTGDVIVTRIGNLTAIGTGYYVQVDQGNVIVVAKRDLDGVLDMLVNPPVLPTPTPEVTETPIPEAEPSPTP
jgi:hypothetical protein